MRFRILLIAFLLFALLPTRSSTQGSAPVCFWSDGGLACVERAPGMGVAGSPDARSALEALLAGPTPQERAQGLWSAIPSGTTLAGVDVGPDLTVVVRLDVPPEALRPLDPMTLEIIVEQIGGTLESLHWHDLRIQTRDPETGAFVPLADFLPEMPTPRKETALAEPGVPSLPQQMGEFAAGQPPAPGQGQPQGALSGKTVYVSAGHGWEWTGSAWRVQRIPYPRPPYVGPIIEDFNNAEAVNQYLLQYLWNAGARVFPVRERDMNQAEHLVDNDSSPPGTGYSESGAWSSASGGYRGLTYRYATTVVGAPTATATWSATLPADGRYAVYVWYRQGSNRAADARYVVRHAGGETTVVVNQRFHGNTWYYLGTYGFLAGQEARVTLTNQSNVAGQAVIADAVRFGGGFFDDPDLSGIQTSAPYAPNRPWWEISAFYQVQRMGMDPDDWPYFNDIVARPMYARWEHAGSGEDAVYVSWHTNGANGTTRGTMSIVHNGEGNPVTPGSVALRNAIHAELVGDIRAGWDPTWPEYTRSMNLGELRELWDSDSTVRMPGALIEIAYHDSPSDADALKEPAFEMLAARAVYQGIVKYFEQRDDIDLTLLPEPPTHLAVRNVGGGQVRVSWFPSPTDSLGLGGDAATGYRVYTSTNGIGWSNGVDVATTAYTLTGLAPGQLVFVRVTATNAGGESFPTETLAARVGDGADVLLVNGFDRLNRGMLVPDYYAPTNETHLRMLLDRMNRYDYTIQHGEVISYPFDSASNEAVQAGAVRLSDYVVVDWILGEESTTDETLNATEQALVGNFLDSGGALFISGSEIGWDLDLYGSDSDRAFYNTYLRADYAGDDAETYTVAPAAGSIFEGLAPLHFDAPGMYDPDYPDQLTPLNGSVAALTYQGGRGGTAAVQYVDGCRRLVYLGFPFETIRPEERSAVMGRVLDLVNFCWLDTHITGPLNNSALNTVPYFAGTAETGGVSVQRVEVQVQRKRDGQYWAGSGWQAGETWLTASGTERWSYDLSSALNGDDRYVLRARAWAADGISDTIPDEVTFTYDTVSPAATILITPTGGVSITAVLARLEWQPLPPDGGTPLGYAVRLDDRFYRTAQSVLTVPITEGLHTWGVQVFDAAGNRSAWVTDTFSVRQYHTWLPLVMRNFVQTPPVCPDLIVNGGFEADWGVEQSHRCLVLPEGAAPYMTDIGNIFTPPGWTTWFRHQPDTWDQPEARDAHLSIDPRRVHSGQKAMLLFTFYRKHDAGFLQQVQVTPGARLRLTAWAHAWSNSQGGSHPDDGRWSEGPGYDCGFELEGTPGLNSDWRNFTFRLGIDPTGGTNPFAGTVVWGQGAHIYNCYAQVPAVETTAQAETVTVFLRSTTLWPFKHNDAYWDDVRLEVCP